MKNRVFDIAWQRVASIGSDEHGAMLVMTLAIFFFLFMLVSGVYTVGESVHRRIELQNACDAAAYSAAVVQADGLSRIATVNRAMAWTYVQMVRRQLDYITYRWLKLTYKQFKEDRDAAKDWHFYLLPCDEHHDQDGTGWWCGLGPNDGMDWIRINQRESIEVEKLKQLLDMLESQMDGGSGSTDGGTPWVSVPKDESLFQKMDSLFAVNDLNSAVKNEAFQKIQEATRNGRPPTPADIEKIYRDIYVRTFPEPPRDESSIGMGIGLSKWDIWYMGLKGFTEENKITALDYHCSVCGLPTMGYSHDACIQQMMDNYNKQASSQQGSSGGSTSSVDATSTSKYKWGSRLATEIANDKRCIEAMNESLSVIAANMTESMKETAKQVLKLNLPKNGDGEVSDDYLFAIQVPTVNNPYEDSENGSDGIFSPMYNTEEYETLFLSMMDGNVYDSLVKYFKDGTSESVVKGQYGSRIGRAIGGAIGGAAGVLGGSVFGGGMPGAVIGATAGGGIGTSIGGALGGLFDDQFGGGEKGEGIDQWFIRTYPEETLMNNRKNIKATRDSYCAKGISRSYKNANRDEGKCLTGQSRSNHVLSPKDDNLGIGRGDDMFGIGKMFSSFIDSVKQEIDLAPTCNNSRLRFREMCRKVLDTTGLVSQYRWCSAKWFCFFTVHTFGIEWHHPFFPKFYCPDHGYGTFWVVDQFKAIFSGMTRQDYRNCYMGADNVFILKGHVRIYGDDKDLVDQHYTGVPARPWMLNENFFNGGGTISVGLARRQRNPWQRVLSWFNDFDAASPNVSSGIMSLFNINPDNHIWTASTARAAYRRPCDGLDGNHADYDMKYDVSAWPNALDIEHAEVFEGISSNLDPTAMISTTADLVKDIKDNGFISRNYSQDATDRVGCVCGKGDNSKRLEHAWNLGTPDWDATLLPVRYAKGFIGKYESINGNGCNWTGSRGGETVFETLGGLKWKGLGDSSSNELRGTTIMQLTNQDGKELGNMAELQKLKIY